MRKIKMRFARVVAIYGFAIMTSSCGYNSTCQSYREFAGTNSNLLHVISWSDENIFSISNHDDFTFARRRIGLGESVLLSREPPFLRALADGSDVRVIFTNSGVPEAVYFGAHPRYGIVVVKDPKESNTLIRRWQLEPISDRIYLYCYTDR